MKKNYLEKELGRLVDVIAHDYAPEKIILFGSLANGEIHSVSQKWIVKR